jgi:hypothetical protein
MKMRSSDEEWRVICTTEKSLRYIYVITDTLRGYNYIGQRTCPKTKTPETDDYFGSGAHLKNAIKLYGIEHFSKRIIIQGIMTRKEIDDYERFYIKEYREKSNAYYNKADGGYYDGPNVHLCGKDNPFYGKQHTPEVMEKIKQKLRGKPLSEEHKHHLSVALKGLRKGVIFSKEHRKHMSESKRKSFENPEYREKYKGLKSEEHKKHMSENHADVNGENNPAFGRHWYTNGKEQVYTYECPEGFKPGCLKSFFKKGGKWYNDGVKSKLFFPDDDIPQEYKPGRGDKSLWKNK